MEDAVWLSRMGWKKAVERFSRKGRRVLGICGGYQLMGKKIKDPYGVESDREEVSGLNLLPVTTSLEKDKVVRKVVGTCLTNGERVKGYEIHMGKSRILKDEGKPFLGIGKEGEKESRQDGWSLNEGLISGTYLHGLFDLPGFRGDFLNRMRKAKGLKAKKPKQGRVTKGRQYDRLADHFETHCDVQKILARVLSS
jgi:adenosylcobyric acid synthase